MWENTLDTLYRMLETRGYQAVDKVPPDIVHKLQHRQGFSHDICMTQPPVIIHLNNEKKIGIKVIRHLLQTMEKLQVRHGICVFLQAPTPFARRYLINLQRENPDIRIEYFFASNMQFDITQHALMPKHTRLPEEKKDAVLARYGRNLALYPKILLTDPMARYLGLQKDDMVQIERVVANQGVATVYRVACPA